PVISDYSTGVCSGLSGNLQINLLELAGSAPGTTFSWVTAGNPSVMGEPLSGTTSTISSAVVSNITNTAQALVYTVTPVSDRGCVGETFTVTVEVYPTPAGNVALNGDLSLCPEESRLLHGLVSGDQSPYVHTWTFIEETDADALMNSGAGFVDGPATGDSIILKALSASGGFVKLRHVVSDVNGCLSKATDVRFTIVPNPLPNAIAAGDDTPCPESTVSYSVTGNAGNTYLWTLSSGGVLLAPTNTHSVSVLWGAVPGGPYLLRLRETNPDGCYTDNMIQIDTVVTPFTLSTTKTDVSCHGGSNGAINLEVSGNLAPFGYDWSNDGAEDPDNDPQELANLPAGISTVTVTDATGC
ncbi:MAG: PKD-like domain-containing protein, partial [Saprospiraceae bacterium]